MAGMRPTYILLPGLHGTGGLFGELLREMPAEHPRRVVDYPRDRVMGYRALVEFVESQVQAEREMILVAESFSGAVALELAARHPDRVKAVVLCASFIAPPVPRILCWLGAPLALVGFPIPRFAVGLFLGGRGGSRELRRAVIREVRSVRSHVIAHRVLLASLVDARLALRNCEAPVLCLAGKRDRLLGSRSWKSIRAIRPDLPVHLIDGPHLLLQLHAREAWERITAFTQPSASSNHQRATARVLGKQGSEWL